MPDDLRCFCAKHPLLARIGRDDLGRPFAHIKVYKGGKVYGELILESGRLRLRCRDCGRWHTLRVRHVGVEFTPIER